VDRSKYSLTYDSFNRILYPAFGAHFFIQNKSFSLASPLMRLLSKFVRDISSISIACDCIKTMGIHNFECSWTICISTKSRTVLVYVLFLNLWWVINTQGDHKNMNNIIQILCLKSFGHTYTYIHHSCRYIR